MASQPLIRPGGRSERIQRAVHFAVKCLLEEIGEAELSIALIAARAEVTPSTIYRRWNTLPDLLAAVASSDFHADRDPPDTGSFRGDLAAWVEQFVDDLSGGLGRAMLNERVTNVALARQTAGYAFANLTVIRAQALARGEVVTDADHLMDLIVAPIVYRLIFAGQTIPIEYQGQLVANAMSSVGQASPPDQISYRHYLQYA